MNWRHSLRHHMRRLSGEQSYSAALCCILYYAATFNLPFLRKYGLRKLGRQLTRSGVFRNPDELGMCSINADAQVDYMIRHFRPPSVLDLGAGTGRSLARFLAAGIDAWGVEASDLARAHSCCPHRLIPGDLTRPLPPLPRSSFDLVWCFEVAEHLPEVHVGVFLDNLTAHGHILLLSAAPPGQGGEGHFNEQPPAYWIKKLRQRGFHLDPQHTRDIQSLDDSVLTKNCLVFLRTAPVNASTPP